MGLDGGNQRDSYATKTNSSAAAAKESTDKPKKMTWATIASQPVKSSQARVSSTLKKKPGMPPPPMIPGKHNMDIGSWDTEKNGSALVPPPVPSPPPVIDDGPSPFQFQPTKNNSNSSNAQQPNNPQAPPPNRNGDRYRDDRGPITRDRDPRDTRDTRDVREPRESRDMREPRDMRDPRDQRDPRDPRDPRDSRGPPDSHAYEMRGGYRQNPNNRYQPHNRSNYNNPNQERQSYHDNPRYQPRQPYRSSPPSYNQSFSNGPSRHYGHDNAENDHPKPHVENENVKPAPVEPEPVADDLEEPGK